MNSCLELYNTFVGKFFKNLIKYLFRAKFDIESVDIFTVKFKVASMLNKQNNICNKTRVVHCLLQ